MLCTAAAAEHASTLPAAPAVGDSTAGAAGAPVPEANCDDKFAKNELASAAALGAGRAAGCAERVRPPGAGEAAPACAGGPPAAEIAAPAWAEGAAAAAAAGPLY